MFIGNTCVQSKAGSGKAIRTARATGAADIVLLVLALAVALHRGLLAAGACGFVGADAAGAVVATAAGSGDGRHIEGDCLCWWFIESCGLAVCCEGQEGLGL